MIIAGALALFTMPETATIFMIDRLVTVASFLSVIEAHLAKNQLAESCIEAFLADEATVYMSWHWTNAIHGIKLVVNDEDVEAARELLAADSGAPPTAAAEELRAMMAEEMPAADADEAEADEPEVLTRREEIAERAFRGAVISIWLVPWQLYVTW